MIPRKSVLVVDDDLGLCWAIKKLLSPELYDVVVANRAEEALQMVQNGFVGVVVLDLNLPDQPGDWLFEKIQNIRPENPVIFLTGFGTTDLALQLIQKGAFDFIEKSHLKVRLNDAVSNAFELLEEHENAQMMMETGRVELAFSDLVTDSPEMRAIFRILKSVLASNVTVLVEGESGTGKELVARALHKAGVRQGNPFVALNCAGIPETLLEAELFGYERGAFTGAVQRKIGRYELANKGTLFLDEIGELQPNMQAKMLRLLENGEFQRLGGLETLSADVRLVSATHRRLDREILEGRFREDLYYRLAVFKVELPALRERTGDIQVLTKYFLEEQALTENRIFEGIDERAMDLLERYDYPGNVRELRNIISHAVVTSKGPFVTISDLPPDFLRRMSAGPSSIQNPVPVSHFQHAPPGHQSLRESEVTSVTSEFPTLKEMEKLHVEKALTASDGNKAEAARLLGINRVTLYRKIRDYDLAESEIQGL